MTQTRAAVDPIRDSAVRDRLYEKYRSYQNAGDPQVERTQRAPYLRRLIKTHLPADRNIRVLDLGCGSGTILHFLIEAGYRNVFGIDTSAEQIAQARELGIGEVEQCDVFSFLQNAEGESYDVVIAFDIIEHLTKPELFELVGEIYRVLTPGGLWIAHAPNAEGVFGARIRYADLTHEQAFTRESIEQLGRVSGFRAVECLEDEPVIHGVKSMGRWLVWKSARALLRIYVMAETGDVGRGAVFSQNLLACARK
jgi:2-polyprenyl-3-methyl-5-hydroxy-6-metoxy-1,4-benzoquinol methylase